MRSATEIVAAKGCAIQGGMSRIGSPGAVLPARLSVSNGLLAASRGNPDTTSARRTASEAEAACRRGLTKNSYWAYSPGTPLHRGSRRVHRITLAEGRRSRGAHPVVRGSGVRLDTRAMRAGRKADADRSSRRPPPGHYELGAVGLLEALPKGTLTSGVEEGGGLKPHKNRVGRRARPAS
jgi:hypothetical protein